MKEGANPADVLTAGLQRWPPAAFIQHQREHRRQARSKETFCGARPQRPNQNLSADPEADEELQVET